MPRTTSDYQVQDVPATTYPVTTQITELSMPAISGYTNAQVTFDSEDPISPNPSLGKVNTISGPYIPEYKAGGPFLEVQTWVVGSGSAATTVQYLYYQLDSSKTNYLFYASDNADGSGATQIGTVPTTSTDKTKTTQKLVYKQPDSTQPVIVIGSIVIDPPVES